MRIVRRTAHVIVALLLVILAPVSASPAWAATTVNGSGSTFAYVAIQQWMSDVARLKGLSVNFAPKGSTQGRQEFASRLVDFASSDVSYNFPGGLGVEQDPSFKFTYMPLVAGGTSIMFNVRDNAGRPIRDIQLSGQLLVRLFTQNMFSCADTSQPVMYWDDPAVKAENPSLANRLPHVRVRPVARTGGSGTTAVFTDYLNQMDPDRWKAYMEGVAGNPNGCSTEKSVKCTDRACGPTDVWPQRPDIDLVDGSDRVAIQVANGNASWGWIGYAEYAYALQIDVPVARIKNSNGSYTLPTACNQAIALTAAQRNPDGTYKLDKVHTHPDPNAYPISSYNYVIVPTDGFDRAKGETLSQFVLYSITDGQKSVDEIGYSPLPGNLIQQGFDVLDQVPGHPTIPSSPDTWGQYYKDLTLPNGKKCADSGESSIKDPPPSNGGGGGGGGGGNGGGGGGNGGGGNGGGGGGNGGGGNGGGGGGNGGGGNGNGGNTPNHNGGDPSNGPTTPGSTTPGTTIGPDGVPMTVDENGQPIPVTGGNGSIDPNLAAGAAKELDTVASSAGPPWGLFGLALAVLAIVFAPLILGGLRRLIRMGGRPTE
ncbi:substrate-binding domain-containing protein [Planotetraspora phitsanulokensis]|uniref:PBP domain-containing protein n=1 Tax=Planotetraspora phitsanulokensis TaxID=575192 RepID=A0A8J3U3X3_9ACTN|nr:substrate-binding domain-containing protein [Planotetraspora phitsanulokensis]GII37750.1 hypothetical protein Pph01_27530 [Planotetraspora phitsanulokensis]